MDKKQPLALIWSIEEPSLTKEGCWHIDVMATRAGDEEMLGYGWTALWGVSAPTVTAVFAQREATTCLRLLYSAFTALHDPEDYMEQIGLGWRPSTPRIPGAMVGSVRGHGAMQVYVRWETSPGAADFMIYPPDSAARAQAVAVLGIQSVAHIAQATEEAFKRLEWPIPA